MMEIIPKNTNIDFVGKRKMWMTISTLALLTSVILLCTKGLNYGIDFTGGAEVQLKFKSAITTSELRELMDKGGFKSTHVQQLGEESADEYLVKFQGDESDLQQVAPRVEKALSSKMQRSDFDVQRVDVVGPQAGSELRKSGFLSLFYAMLCILIYVAIRFDVRYAPGAVIALFHDSVFTAGILVLTQKEFSLQTVAALLTIIGYSNNDTIIVYDRIRETIRNYPNRGLEENVNRSINETLSRTLLTSGCTLIVVLALMIFGGGVIHDFAFAMCIGIVVGTYSSIFVASPVVIFLTHFQERRALKAKNMGRVQPQPGAPGSRPVKA